MLASQVPEKTPGSQPVVRFLETWDRSFAEFKGFSDRISKSIAANGMEQDLKSLQPDLTIAKTVFNKWALEILENLSHRGSLGFEALRSQIGASPTILSHKLKGLQKIGVIQREVVNSRPARVNYSLTKKGISLCKLVRPFLLFLSVL